MPLGVIAAALVTATLLAAIPATTPSGAEPAPAPEARTAGTPSFAPDPYFFTPPAGFELVPSKQVFFVKTGQIDPRTGRLFNCGWVHYLIVQDRGPGAYGRVSRQNGTTNAPFGLGPRTDSLTAASGYPLDAPPGATLTQITGTGFGCSPTDFALIERERARLAGLEYNVYFQAATAPPEASFEADPATDGSLQVEFANRSTDRDDLPEQLTHRWRFGDGTSSTEVDPVHTYAEPGEYSVTLTVTDSRGLRDSDTQVVEVRESALDGALFPFPTGDATIKEGERVGLRLRVENQGDEALTDVAVTDIVLTPTDEAGAGRATISPTPGGATLSGTLGTGGGGANLDFADYDVVADAAGAVRLDVTVQASEPDGDVISRVIPWELTIRPAPIRVELEVGYAEPPGGATEPPGFQKDNNEDGEVDERDHRIEIEVTATNVSDGEVAAVEVRDAVEPIDFDDRYLGGGEVFLDPLDLPAETEFGDLGPGESETLTFAYEAKEPVWADATTIVQGREGDATGPLVTGVGRAEVKLDADLALEAWMDVEERPYQSGQVVRLNGEITNLLEDETRPDGTVDEANSLAVILDPIVEGNASNGYVVPADFGGRTPQGNTPFVLAPGETLEVRAIVPTARKGDASTAGIRYLVRAWELDDEQPDELGIEIDQSRIVIDEEGGRGKEFSVGLSSVQLAPDRLEECETEILDAIVSCNLWVGLREFGIGLGQVGLLVGQGSVDYVRATFAIRAWVFEQMHDVARSILGDPAAMQRLSTEIEVQLETFVAARVMSAEALDAVGNSVVEFFQEAERVLATGDTNAIVAWASRFLGENPDLGLGAIAKVRAARALFGVALPSASQSEATVALVRAADESVAAERASLSSRVDEAIARGENPATNGTFKGDEVVTNLPRVFRGIYGARKSELNKMLELAKAENILIAFRSRAPRAADLIRDGLARLKPMDVKTKGVNEIDIAYLGYRREAKDLVELVEPPIDWRLTKKGREAEFEAALDEHMAKLKARHPEIGADPVWESEVRDRLATRTKEWAKEVPNFRRYKTEGINVEFGYAEQGLPASLDDHVAETRRARVTTGTVVDPITGKERLYMTLEMADSKGENFLPITGDIDIVAVLNADRTPLTDVTKRTRIYRELNKLVGMQHGDSFTWVNGEGQIKFMREHLAGKEGTEALVVAGSDGQARMGYFEERLSTVADADGNEVSKTTFHLLTGGPRELVTDAAGGVATNLPGYLDQLEGYVLDPRFYLPGALEDFMDGIDTAGLGPAELDGEAPAVRPDGEGGAEVYVPPGASGSATAMASADAAAVPAAEEDPLEAAAAEVVAEGFGPAPAPEVGAQGGRWAPFDAAAAAAASPTGRFPRGVATALDGGATAGTKVLAVSGFDVLGVGPGSDWFEVGDEMVVDPGGAGEERHVVASVDPLTTVEPLANDHRHATSVVLVPRQTGPEPTTTTSTPTTSTPTTSMPTTSGPPTGSSTTAATSAPASATTEPATGPGRSDGASGELARTGTSAVDLVPLALVLSVAGATVLIVRGRTRRRLS